jgi:hypothetical protein
MKNITLLMIVCAWSLRSPAQSEAGLEQYYYMNNKAIAIAPLAWYQSTKGWYLEGGYNYAAENTLSVYFGKTFARKSALSYSVSPLVGGLQGDYNGLSFGLNTDADYKKLYFSLQSQYTVSLTAGGSDFIYNWGDLGYQALPWLSAGISVQQTNTVNTKAVLEKGMFFKAALGRWEFPLYFFAPASNERYTVLGLNYALPSRKVAVPVSRQPN